MTKEEKIKEAYGGLIDLSVLDENGWAIYGCEDFSESGIEPFGEYETKNHIAGVCNWRPKSLQGIENNNGWIKIESEKILFEKPENCLFEWYNIFDKRYDVGEHFNYGVFTHFKVIPEPKQELPLY